MQKTNYFKICTYICLTAIVFKNTKHVSTNVANNYITWNWNMFKMFITDLKDVMLFFCILWFLNITLFITYKNGKNITYIQNTFTHVLDYKILLIYIMSSLISFLSFKLVNMNMTPFLFITGLLAIYPKE